MLLQLSRVIEKRLHFGESMGDFEKRKLRLGFFLSTLSHLFGFLFIIFIYFISFFILSFLFIILYWYFVTVQILSLKLECIRYLIFVSNKTVSDWEYFYCIKVVNTYKWYLINRIKKNLKTKLEYKRSEYKVDIIWLKLPNNGERYAIPKNRLNCK